MNVNDEIRAERIRAHQKHDTNGGSMERKRWADPVWLAVVGEEYGELCRAVCERALGNQDEHQTADHLREELVQVAAMVTAWIDAIDAMFQGNGDRRWHVMTAPNTGWTWRHDGGTDDDPDGHPCDDCGHAVGWIPNDDDDAMSGRGRPLYDWRPYVETTHPRNTATGGVALVVVRLCEDCGACC